MGLLAALIYFLIYLIVFGLIGALLVWIVSIAPLPAQYRTPAKWIIWAFLAIVFLLLILKLLIPALPGF